jgi:DNA-binding response OmpR family regulator
MTPIKLLFVDDEPDICRFVEAGLKSSSIVTTLAYDGLEAQKIFLSTEFDIVVTDVRMPKCTGFQLLQFIKSKDSAMPVLICSAYTNDFRIVTDAHANAPDGLINKPFEISELAETIRSKARMPKLGAA